MTRNLEKLAIDEREQAILDKLPASTLVEVVDIKRIFGANSRVVSFKPGLVSEEQLDFSKTEVTAAKSNGNGAATEKDDEILRAWDEATELPAQQETKIDGGEAWKEKVIDERFTFNDEEIEQAGKEDEKIFNAGDRPTLSAGNRNLSEISAATLKILIAANEPPFMFRHADMLSRVQVSDDGSTVIRQLSENSLRHILSQLIFWFVTKKDVRVPDLPPLHVVRDILATPEPPFPIIIRVVRSPIFAADGTLRTKAGYDATSKTFYDPFEDFDVRIPQAPKAEDITYARDVIADLLFDFPFAGETERTHAIGLLLLPFARELIDGPTPLHLIEKPSPGTGAGLLTDVSTTVFLGHSAATMTEGRDEDEWRKRIMSKLLAHNDMIIIDNVRRRLESSALSAALTSIVFEDRILGKTAMVRVPVRMTWIATGNNPALSNEMVRRTIRIRLDSKIDRPWLRDGFRHPNLREYVAKEREKLVFAALVLIQDWIAKGKPEGAKRLGSFENWAKVMGGILGNAGFQGFLGNLDELYEASDAEGEAWRTLVARWWEAHGEDEVGVADIFSLVVSVDGDPIDLDLGKDSERSQKTKLGQRLKHARDRQFDGKRIIKGGTKQGAQQWRLQNTEK